MPRSARAGQYTTEESAEKLVALCVRFSPNRSGGVMKFVYFTHSLASCWNHGNAHFLRGVLRELIARGHDVAR